MAILIEANYGKTIGLPGFSSHKFCVSIKSEIQNQAEIISEVSRLYATLQDSVDRNIIHSGFMPGDDDPPSPDKSKQNGQHRAAASSCSPKQISYIETLAAKEKIPQEQVAAICDRMFGKPLSRLNRLEASGLIDELKQYSAKSLNGHPVNGSHVNGSPNGTFARQWCGVPA